MDKIYSPFSQARVMLTAWYCFILAIILVIFSLALYSSQSKDFVRIILLQDFGNHTPRILTSIERKEILEQLQALRQTTRVSLLTIDAVVMLLGAGLSFLLAGKTLEPIAVMLDKQAQFLADASHELRTPLSALQLSTEVALRSDRTKEEYHLVLSNAHEEIVRLGKIVNDLLFLSRTDTNTDNHIFSNVALTSIIEETIQSLTPLISKKELILETHLDNKITIQGDTDKLKQLILILLDNAIKYTPNKGKIIITFKKKSKPLLTIKDTGIGMNESEIEQIFQRFYRADNSRSTPGVGLGLSIAKSIAELHDAKITVISALRQGSTFCVLFNSH